MTTTATTPLVRARTAVAVVFTVNGFMVASWMSRLPLVRDELDQRLRTDEGVAPVSPWRDGSPSASARAPS